MRREPWTLEPPVDTAAKTISHFREVEDDGTEWYVALGPDGKEITRACVKPMGAFLADMKMDRTKRKNPEALSPRERRLEELREKRRAGKALTAAEKNELLDLLLGV
jgi:hypothetical protein